MKKLCIPLISLLVVVALGAPAEAAPKRYKVSIGASATTVDAGATVSLSGKVTPRAAGRRVILLKREGSGGWKRVSAAKLNRASRYAFIVRPGATAEYKVTKAKKGKRKAGTSRTVRVSLRTPGSAPEPTPTPVREPATLTVTPPASTELDAGANFTLSGNASANLAGQTVELQIKDGESWSTLGTGVVQPDTTFSLSAIATTAGRAQEVRVRAKASATTQAAASAPVSLTVFGWYDLARWRAVQGSDDRGSVNINGTTYASALYAGVWEDSTNTAEYDLARKCTRYRATAGVSDTAHSSTVYTARVHADNVERWSKSGVGLGTSSAIDVDLTGALRIRFTYIKTAGRGTGAFAHGDARVRCAL